jgi:hypothetical protein
VQLEQFKRAKTRSCSVYDGHDLLGRIVVRDGGEAVVFDSGGKRLGKFSDFDTALAAVPANAPERVR